MWLRCVSLQSYKPVCERSLRMQVCDEPTILLIDTPGIMLPKLKESMFAYRVALAGLVQEAQVSLQELFAFTLYVLSQQPNKGQLKVVLSHSLPSDDARQSRFTDGASSSAHLRRSPQGALRHAYASKRFAKCILQGVDEVLEAMTAESIDEDTESDDIDTPAVQHGMLNHRQDDRMFQMEPTNTLGNRPHFAHEHLSLMGSARESNEYPARASPPRVSAIVDRHSTGGVDVSAKRFCDLSLTEAANVTSTQPRESNSAAMQPLLRRQRSTARPWIPYNSEFWAICANAVLRKLLKIDHAGASDKLQNEQVTASMERIIRMTRSGDFGPLVFEQPPFGK